MATRPEPIDDQAVKVDRVISRAFAAMRGNPVVVFGLSLIFGGLPGAIINGFTRGYRPAQPIVPAELAGYGIAMMIGGVLVILFYVLAQGALVRATIAQGEGRRAGFGECAAVGLRASVPLIGLNILLGIAVGIGFLLFFVPGVILFTIWAVANPALVAERTGVFAAFSRSRHLTRGTRWKVFGIELIATVIVWLLSSVLSIFVLAGGGFAAMAAMGRAGQPLWYLVLSAIIQMIVVAIWGTIQASLYIELRDWKDGPDGASLADVFA